MKHPYLVPLSIIIAGALIGVGLAYGLGNTAGTLGQTRSLEDIVASIGVDTEAYNACMEENRYAQRVANDYEEAVGTGGQGTPHFILLTQAGQKITVRGAQPFEEFQRLIDAVIAGEPLPQPYVSQEMSLRDISVETDHIRGNVNAPITLLEYTDFDCPFCKRAHPIVQRIIEEYEGQVRLVYRHFPLTQLHPDAVRKALASECVAEQGKFWELADELLAA